MKLQTSPSQCYIKSKYLLKNFCKKIARIHFLLLLIFIVGAVCEANAETIKFKIIAVNPSQTRTQRVPIKVYLPEEVGPGDVVDLGGLEMEYDATKSLYYVYSEDILLNPAQTQVFEVEVNDIWLIPEDELEGMEKKVKYLQAAFEGSEYGPQVDELAVQAETLHEEVLSRQSDDSISRSQHIGVYRTNTKALAHLKQKIEELEKILEQEEGPLSPEMLAKTKFKSDSPTRTATWIAIFVIAFFLGLLSFIVFFTWYRQSKATDKILAEAKKTAFLDIGKGKER